ncbi:uncharacterized protein CXorf58 homolog [Amia ocellicauda]|uniref:uncharacterized protein CXorf58 homolog n=1 Tax=Amia ocellicauda TaxID=2972642 RepID=UPI003464E283
MQISALGPSERMDINDAAITIQRSWRSHRDRRLFRLLKHTVIAAEHCLTAEVLRKLSPSEAELLRDPSLKCKVRFRFSGCEFPPVLVFKIFHQRGGSKYITGRRAFSRASAAAADACKIMGRRMFFNQIVLDEMQRHRQKVVNEEDITCMKDYMQYSSHLDEMPAYMGGRENCWRTLSLQGLKRHGTTQQYSSFTSVRRSAQAPATPKSSSRRSGRARRAAAKMRRLYTLYTGNGVEEKEYKQPPPPGAVDPGEPLGAIPSAPPGEESPFSDSEWEEEAERLCTWTEQLSLEDLGTPASAFISEHA